MRTLLAKTVSDDLRAASGSCQPVDVFNQTIKSSFIGECRTIGLVDEVGFQSVALFDWLMQ